MTQGQGGDTIIITTPSTSPHHQHHHTITIIITPSPHHHHHTTITITTINTPPHHHHTINTSVDERMRMDPCYSPTRYFITSHHNSELKRTRQHGHIIGFPLPHVSPSLVDYTTTQVHIPPFPPNQCIRDESFLSKKHVVYHNMYSRPEYPHNDLPHNDFPFSLDLRGRNDPTSR